MSDGFVLSSAAHPVEHIGGPDDGAFLPANASGWRPNGMYVDVSCTCGYVRAKQYVPREAWQA